MGITRQRSGVIGAGYMGALHCKAYSLLDPQNFTGIYDADPVRAAQIAEQYKTKVFEDVKDLISECDVLSIAVPTVLHNQYALLCVGAGKHVLIEKPIASTVADARGIVDAAERNSATTAVGYIERFNPAVKGLLSLVRNKKIRNIIARRMAPPAARANDVSAVFDLMIHDLDIVLNIAGADAYGVEASGKKIDSAVFNEAVAGLKFNGGITARLETSKVATEKARTITVECDGVVYEADLISRVIAEKIGGRISETSFSGEEPILAEVRDFVSAVNDNRKPEVSGRDSLRSFELASRIEELLTKS